jgi:hypothetical protein
VKTVRYAAGAFGALGMLPAAGLAPQAATAATTHPSAVTGKSVRLVPRAADTSICLTQHSHTSSANIRGYIEYSTVVYGQPCVGFEEVHRYNGHPTGELARIRYYSPSDGGTWVAQSFLPGTINTGNNSIRFSNSATHIGISKVCEEIVHASNHNPVSGINPVCQTT